MSDPPNMSWPDYIAKYSTRNDWRDAYTAWIDDKMPQEEHDEFAERYITPERLLFMSIMRLVDKLGER